MKRTEDSVVLTGNIWSDQKLLKTWVTIHESEVILKHSDGTKDKKHMITSKYPEKKISWQSTA